MNSGSNIDNKSTIYLGLTYDVLLYSSMDLSDMDYISIGIREAMKDLRIPEVRTVRNCITNVEEKVMIN